MVELFANNGDADHTPRSVASDLGLYCLPITLLRIPDYNGLIKDCHGQVMVADL